MPRQAQAQPEGGEADDLENGFEGDPGSFFWYFQEKADFFNVRCFFFFWNITERADMVLGNSLASNSRMISFPRRLPTLKAVARAVSGPTLTMMTTTTRSTRRMMRMRMRLIWKRMKSPRRRERCVKMGAAKKCAFVPG